MKNEERPVITRANQEQPALTSNMPPGGSAVNDALTSLLSAAAEAGARRALEQVTAGPFPGGSHSNNLPSDIVRRSTL